MLLRIAALARFAESGGAHGIVDEDFAGDVEKGIAAHDEPWNPSGLD
jgi:hypothetical protein